MIISGNEEETNLTNETDDDKEYSIKVLEDAIFLDYTDDDPEKDFEYYDELFEEE